MKHKFLFEQYIKGTPRKSRVVDKRVLVCRLKKTSMKGVDLKVGKVYINTRAIKHLYDKKPAEEFDFI